MQRCVFLLKPFCARRWRRRYDVLISATVWVVVGLACSPFILMRSSNSASASHNLAYTREPLAHIQTYASPLYTGSSPSRPTSSAIPHRAGCFKDLPTRQLPLAVAATMMAFAELLGFLLPLAAISYSSIRIAHSLRQRPKLEQHNTLAPLRPSIRHRTLSSSSACQSDRQMDKQTDGEKRRALRMVLSCSALFLLCFAPYHLNFLLYLMVSQDIVSHCATRLAVLKFHPVSLCLASLSCCLNPLLYYFLTAEFRQHLSRRTSSFTASLISSPRSSASQRPALLRGRLKSMESTSSCRE